MSDVDYPFPGRPLGNGLYEVDLDQMDDVEIFRAGAPGFNTDGVPFPHEAINADTPLGPVDVVLYYDRKSKIPVEEGVNQQAFVVDSEQALFVSGNKVRSIKLAELRMMPNAMVIRGIHEALAPYVAKTLLSFRNDHIWFGFSTNHIRCNNYVPFVTGQFFPSDPVYADDGEYELAWQRFLSTLEPHDYILTFDRRSLLSKIIARVTHGPFSHIAHYMGDGNIWEVVTSGTRIAPLDTYKGRHFRVACYRHAPGLLRSAEESEAHYRATAGRPGYGYWGAIKAGIRTYFGDKYITPMTPNGIILAGPFTFISQV